LRFDDLFGHVAANLDHALVVRFSQFRNTQHVLSGRNGRQDHAARSAHAAVTLVVYVNLSSGRRHDDES